MLSGSLMELGVLKLFLLPACSSEIHDSATEWVCFGAVHRIFVGLDMVLRCWVQATGSFERMGNHSMYHQYEFAKNTRSGC